MNQSQEIELSAEELSDTGLSFSGMPCIDNVGAPSIIMGTREDSIVMCDFYDREDWYETDQKVKVLKSDLLKFWLGALKKVIPNSEIISCDYKNESEWAMVFSRVAEDGMVYIDHVLNCKNAPHYGFLAKHLGTETYTKTGNGWGRG